MEAVFPHMMNSILKAFKKISSTCERHLKCDRTLRDLGGGGGGGYHYFDQVMPLSPVTKPDFLLVWHSQFIFL